MKHTLGILMLLGTILIYGQEPVSSLNLTGGYTTNGIGLHLSYNYNLSNKHRIQTALYASDAEDKQETVSIPYNDLTFNIGYFYDFYKDEYKRLNLSLGGGGLVGYEDINGGENVLETGAVINGENQLIYGLFIGAEIDYLISDNISLLSVVNQYYHINSDLGNTVFYGGLGIKFYFY